MGIIAGIVPLLVLCMLVYDRWVKPPVATSQFTIRDLMISTAMVAVALCVFTLPVRIPTEFLANSEALEFVVLVLWFTSGPVFFAGLFRPFKKAILGAVFGAVVQVLGTCILLAIVSGRS